MRFYINGIEDERLHRPLQLISNLFYEETELFFNEEEADIRIAYEVELKNGSVSVKGVLSGQNGYNGEARHEKELSAQLTEKEIFHFY